MTPIGLDSATCWHLTLALWHTCWLGLVVGGLAAAGNRMWRGAPARQRYWLNFGAMAAMGACLPVSFAVVRATDRNADKSTAAVAVETVPVAGPLSEIAHESFGVSPSAAPVMHEDSGAAMPPARVLDDARTPRRDVRDPDPVLSRALFGQRMHAAAPYVTAAYLLGVFAMLVKLIVAVYGGKRLRAGCLPVVDRHLIEMLGRQSHRLALRLVPAVACCERVAVPVVVGVVRPMILMPAAMMTGLTSDELVAVLTHELAHIRRYDHWLILVQRFLEALLFFHPAAWYLSRQVHAERESCCDDLVLATGGDRLVYAQSLLRVAELRLGEDPRRGHLAALAADGQRPSHLRRRIARLLGDAADPRVRFRSRWPAMALGLICAAVLWTVTASAWQVLANPVESLGPPHELTNSAHDGDRVQSDTEPANPGAESLALAAANQDKKDKGVDDPLLAKTLAQIAARGARNFDAIETAHIRFRTSRGGGPYRPGTTPERCSELLQKYDLVKQPDALRDLIEELRDDDGPRTARPWSDCELHVAGPKVREAMYWSERTAPDLHITDGQIALRWDEANSQLNIDPARKSHEYQLGLDDFWRPMRAAQVANPEQFRAVRDRGLATLFYIEDATGHSGEIVVDEGTGFLVRSVTRHRTAGVLEQRYWLGWSSGLGGIPYPSVVIRFSYRTGQLASMSFLVVREMRLNVPVPDSVFQLGVPAGSAVFDSRTNATISGGRLNHDVFDVTSAEQLAEAAKPLDPQARTPQEKFAVAELQRLYALADDEVLKRIGPPYPASRKHLPLLLGERYMAARRDIRSDVIRWKDGQFAGSWPLSGGSYQFQSLITYLLRVTPTEIEGDPALLKQVIAGDFVYRVDGPLDRLAESLGEIAGVEFQKTIRLTFREVERPVYLARGELKLALRPGRQEIAVNGGPHSGHQGEGIAYGDLSKLLQDVASYIHLPVINEAQPASDQLTWSSRWYDLPTTKPEKRFKLDPQVVLKQLTEQTGITFTEGKRTMRVLFVEQDAQ